MSDEKYKSDDNKDNILGDAKEDANEFVDEIKEKASKFTEDAKQVFSDGKNIAIIAHITLIGWIIALFMNNNNKNEFASYYIRQMLGLLIVSFILYFVPVIGWILNLVLIVFWLISLIGALGGEKKETPILGIYFQDWFKSL